MFVSSKRKWELQTLVCRKVHTDNIVYCLVTTEGKISSLIKQKFVRKRVTRKGMWDSENIYLFGFFFPYVAKVH